MNGWLILILGLIVVVVAVAVLAQVRGGEQPGEDQKKLVSLVLLLREPREVNEAELKERFGRVFGVRFSDRPDDENIVKQFRPEMIGVQVRGRRYGLIRVNGRYSEVDPQQLDRADARVRAALIQHKAWIAIDLLDEQVINKSAAYRDIARMLAEFVDDKALLLYCPENEQMVYMHAELQAKLRSDNPFEALEWPNPPVVNVEADDPRMNAAVEEARQRWPEFVQAFKARKPGQAFSAKARFTDGTHDEFMWIEVSAIDGITVRGKLANEPAYIRSLKLHDAVEFKLEDLNDWIYEKDGKLEGAFTVKAIQEIQRERDGK